MSELAERKPRIWGDAPLRVYRNDMFRKWFWECGYCHYGYDIPWETAQTWTEAIVAVDAHISRHIELGTFETWRNALERRTWEEDE